MPIHITHSEEIKQAKTKSIKCVVWDLDNTIWDGVLLEDEHIILRPHIVKIIKELDSRGILNSIASKNDHVTAMAKLDEFNLSEYFLYPQINWSSKGRSIQEIAKLININTDTFAFVDDQPFEREEAAFIIPEILCIDANNLDDLLDMPEMKPRFITEDSKLRRQMYLSDMVRNSVEKGFIGASEEFLATLNMSFIIATAQESDLQRGEELTIRTHQLNTTGYTYSYDELNTFRQSPDHILYISSLEDKYGTYGKIGVSLIECSNEIWTIKLLLMSCRVMSRGVGTIMINHIMNEARKAGMRLQAEFVPTDRNRMMLVTYKFGGFKEVARKENNVVVFEHDLSNIPAFPSYVKVTIVG